MWSLHQYRLSVAVWDKMSLLCLCTLLLPCLHLSLSLSIFLFFILFQVTPILIPLFSSSFVTHSCTHTHPHTPPSYLVRWLYQPFFAPSSSFLLAYTPVHVWYSSLKQNMSLPVNSDYLSLEKIARYRHACSSGSPYATNKPIDIKPRDRRGYGSSPKLFAGRCVSKSIRV